MTKPTTILALAILLLSCVQASRVLLTKKSLHETFQNYEKKTSIFGYEYLYAENRSAQTSHTIYDTKANLMIDSKDMLDYAKSVVSKGPSYERKPKASEIEVCDPSKPDFFKFAAQGTPEMLKPDVELEHKNSHCFSNTKTSWKWDNSNDLTLTIEVFNPSKSMFCSDPYILQVGGQLQFHVIFFHGKHTFSFKNLSQQDKDMLKYQGVRPFITCDNITHLIPDLFKTLGLFLGGLGLVHSPDVPFIGLQPWKMQKEWNVEFIKHATGYQWQSRDSKKVNVPPREQIQSGDYFAITRFDGLDQIIEYGTGSHSGHSTIACWDPRDKELYVIESQDAWYWPLKKGLQKNKYEDWMKAAQNAGFNVAHLPLKKELADKFDEKAVWEWFDSVEGMPYGYRNFLFSWVDTPNDNFPPVLDLNFIYIVFTILEGISPKVGDLLLGEAMNKRLGTTGLDLKSIAVEAGKQGKTFNELFAMVEKEGWKYSDGYSYVCSCFVTKVWKLGGVFGDMELESTEFTPRDIYMLKIFEDGTQRDDSCKKNDANLPYCQLFGEYEMELPGFNSVVPYAHMNEKCPTKPPLYERPDGC